MLVTPPQNTNHAISQKSSENPEVAYQNHLVESISLTNNSCVIFNEFKVFYVLVKTIKKLFISQWNEPEMQCFYSSLIFRNHTRFKEKIKPLLA